MHNHLSRSLLICLLYSAQLFSHEEKPKSRLEQAFTVVKIASVATLTVAALILSVKCYKFVNNSSMALNTIQATLIKAGASLAHIDATAQQATATLAATIPTISALNASIAQINDEIVRAGITVATINNAAGHANNLARRVDEALQQKPLLNALGSKQGQLTMLAVFTSLFRGFNAANPSQTATPSWSNPRDVLPALTHNPGVLRALFTAWRQTKNSPPKPTSASRQRCAMQ